MLFVRQSDTEILSNLKSYLSFISPLLVSEEMRINIINKVIGPDSDKFKFVFSVLYQANIIYSPQGYDSFLTLIQHESLEDLSNVLSIIIDLNILKHTSEGLTKTTLCRVINHEDPQSFITALQRLNKEPYQLIRSEYSLLILIAVFRHHTPLGIASALELLKDYKLLTPQNIVLIAKSRHPMLISDELKALHDSGIPLYLFQEIVLGITTSQSVSDYCRKIKSLYENNTLSMSAILAIRGNCQISELDPYILGQSQLADDIAKYHARGLLFFSPSPLSSMSSAQSASTDSLSSDDSDLSSNEKLRNLLALCGRDCSM